MAGEYHRVVSGSSNETTQIEVFLALRELLSKNHCALEFDDETLAKLLYQERFINRYVEAHEVEEAREALLTDRESFE